MAYGPSITRGRFGPHGRLLLELTCGSVAVIGLLCLSRRAGGRTAYWMIPWVLTLGALVPTFARGGHMRELGFRLGPVRQTMLLLGISGACMLVCGVIGIGVLERLSIEPPLRGVVPRGQWFMWIFFQFGLAALPEELFFRGYFLTNCLRLLRAVVKNHPSAIEYAGVSLSAGVFAVAHVLVLGNAASILAFFPGLVFAWLFVRSGSLLLPTLMHGTANIVYVLAFGGVA